MALSIGIPDDAPGALSPRVIPLDDLHTNHGRGPEFTFGLDIFDVYQELYRTEFQFDRRHDSLITLFRDRSRHGAYVDATFGGFPSREALSYIQKGYVDAFSPTILKHDPPAWLQLVKKGGRTPLTFTRHALKKLSGRGLGPIIFVANPSSPLDLVDLWNLRLIRSHVLPVNSEWLPDLRDFLRDFVTRNHRPLPGNSRGVMIHTTVEIGNSFSEEEANHLIRDTFSDLPKGSLSSKLRYDPIWEHHHQDAVETLRPVQIEADSSHLDLSVSEERRPWIQFQSLTPEFAAEYGFGRARWVNVISLTDFHSQHRLALTLPSTSASSPPFRFGGHNQELVSREGFVLPQRYRRHREHMELRSGTEAVVDWFACHDIVATASDAGRVADQILSSVGGFSGASILQDEKTLRLLDKMSKSTRQRGEDTIEEYTDRTASFQEWLEITKRRGNHDLRARTYLDRFVEAGALKLGLSVTCPNCKKVNWYGLDDLAETLSCERCLKDFRFPQGSLNYKKTPWRFRVAGPYSVPNYANGSYTTVLALNCLVNGGGTGNAITYSTSLNLEVGGEPLLEVDFACWLQKEDPIGRRNEPVFLVGEAKSFAENSFSKDDIDRLKRVGQKMPGTFLVCATLKSELTAPERRRIVALAKWGRSPRTGGYCRNPVIVLTGTELLAPIFGGIAEAWKKVGGIRKDLAKPAYIQMDNPWTLADLTQQAYLELQPTA